MDDILVEESQKRVTSAATGKNQQFLKGFLIYEVIQSVNLFQNFQMHVFWTSFYFIRMHVFWISFLFYLFFNDLQEPLMKNWKLLP